MINHLLFKITLMLTIVGMAASQLDPFQCKYKEDTKREWSTCTSKSVNGLKMKEATLFCNFTFPNTTWAQPIQVIWKKGYAYAKDILQIIFNRNTNTTDANFTGRISLVGDPDHSGTGSIKIRDLKYSDEDLYFCRFERQQGFETNCGTQLIVNSVPEVLNLTKTYIYEAVNSTALLCMVEGKPRPKITWDVPHEIPPPLNVTENTGSENNHHSSLLTVGGELAPGTYTCRASNLYGNVSTFLNVPKRTESNPTTNETTIVFAASAVTFLCVCLMSALITFWACRIRRKKSNREIECDMGSEQVFENTNDVKSGAALGENVDNDNVVYADVRVASASPTRAPATENDDVVYATILHK